jgi:hypothetical protein
MEPEVLGPADLLDRHLESSAAVQVEAQAQLHEERA